MTFFLEREIEEDVSHKLLCVQPGATDFQIMKKKRLQGDVVTALSEQHDAPQRHSPHPGLGSQQCQPSVGVAKLSETRHMPHRGEQTLDHCYTQFTDMYKALSLPVSNKLEHDIIFLLPKYEK